MSMIPYGRQEITESDIESVVSVLRSDFLTQGPKVPQFENAIANYCGAKYAVAANSATSSLHVACLALGLGNGDWLWTSPITFVASANCALYCGAKVDFVDINPVTLNICPQALENKLIAAKKAGTLPKVVVPVHFAGNPCEMREIKELSAKFGFSIVEDASHAIGAKYLDSLIGSCNFSDITVFSFHPVKIITTGEGGVATTNNPDLMTRMSLLRSHGITRDPHCMSGEPDGPWYYEQLDLGYNYRMTDIQAALGLSQLDRLDTYVESRNRLADGYDALLSGLPIVTPFRNSNSRSSMHLYVIRLLLDQIGVSRRQVFNSLRDGGIGVNVHYIPVHMQPHYRRFGFMGGDFPNAEMYYDAAISLPMFARLTDEQQDKVVDVIRDVLSL